ncbi:hypothetical protein [Cohnella sp. WQ 127256]|uniref:hypothetical protein n=1 Tax=Cohnella sp. WQ 127256 TaxID=2938790 RepID=UPI0021188D72|nr:hypothetical protein [Cohnella sp. WQ 127256]
MDDVLVENRREHIRFKLTTPLFAELSLWRVDVREIRSRKQVILLNNMSVGGCQFTTNLLIPVREDVEWLIEYRMGHYFVKLRTVIVHTGHEDGLHTYGARWLMTGLERQAYQYRLNDYMQKVIISSPHIHTLYKKISDRNNDGQFRQFDVTS